MIHPAPAGGLALRLPDADRPLDPGDLLPDPEEVEQMVGAQLPTSALFASRFQENATRRCSSRRRPCQRTLNTCCSSGFTMTPRQLDDLRPDGESASVSRRPTSAAFVRPENDGSAAAMSIWRESFV